MNDKNNILLAWYYVSEIKIPNQQQLRDKGVYLILHVIEGTHVLLAVPLWILNEAQTTSKHKFPNMKRSFNKQG